MAPLEEYRKLYPPLENLPDEEVAKTREVIYAMAQLALENWEREKSGSKNLNWFLPQSEEDIR